MSLSRIYQGRVTNLALLDPRLTEGPAVTSFETLLADHHLLFQDAVNYHMFQLLALASDPASSIGKIRQRLILADLATRKLTTGAELSPTEQAVLEHDVWNDFKKMGEQRKGLRHSWSRWTGLNPAEYPLETALALAAAPPVKLSEELLERDRLAKQLALEALLEDLGGDAAIQQGGREYLPRFCWPKFSGSYPRSASILAKKTMQTELPARLYDPVTLDNLAQLQADLEFAFFANPTGEGINLDAAKSRALFQEAIKEFTATNQLSATDAVRLQGCLTELPEDFVLPAYAGASVKLALRPRFLSFLIFKYLEASPVTFALLRDSHVAPKEKTTTKSTSKKAPAAVTPGVDRLLMLGDDPVKLARNTWGYIYRAFTSLPAWGAAGASELAWKEFDISAFKEALKTFNQIQGRAEEREAKRQLCLDKIRYYEQGGKPPINPSGEEETEGLASFKGDPRFALLQQMLPGIKAQDGEMSDEYTAEKPTQLRWRAIRGHDELFKSWNECVKQGLDKTLTGKGHDEMLMAKLVAHQTEHRDDMGWKLLFKTLTKPENFVIWQAPDSATAAQWRAQDWSFDFLKDYTNYCQLQLDAERLEEPVRFTPADAVHSRRLFMFSDACKFTATGDYRHLPNASAVIVPLAVQDQTSKLWQVRRARLNYAAPRLRRDGLRQEGNETLKQTTWIQPMMAALGVTAHGEQDVSDCAVALMPEPTRDGKETRYLLNFPISLDETLVQQTVAEKRGQTVDWTQQAVAFGKGSERQLFYLRWPEFDKATKDGKSWPNEISTFRTLAIDLGQRSAGAAAIVRAYLGPKTKVQDRFLGQSQHGPWHGQVERRATLRLPGEDALDHTSNRAEERGGASGRNATKEERADTLRFIEDLKQHPAHLGLEDDAAITALSFPELNDKLIIATRRAMGHLRLLQRWAWIAEHGKSADLIEELTDRRLTDLKQQAEGGAAVSGWSAILHQLAEISASNAASLKAEVFTLTEKLQQTLTRAVALLANRIVPLRQQTSKWQQHPENPTSFQLVRADAKGTKSPWVRSNRGLSMSRLEQLTDLRRILQAFNRLAQTETGAKPPTSSETRNQPVPDPCRDLSTKLDAMREQRVNQTAHLILAEALGLRLKPSTQDAAAREAGDWHGEYESVRPPVDFIVVEDLMRYRTTQGRTRQENSRLMQWSHRQITAKLKLLCEPYGIAVFETPAAYSSRFCSRTGQAGFRGQEVSLHDFSHGTWKWMLDKAKKKPEEANNKALIQLHATLQRLESVRHPDTQIPLFEIRHIPPNPFHPTQISDRT